jgi:hypothetical protein
MTKLVDRWGRTGFALASSLIWALPMAAWAGSVDLEPGPGPWVAFAIGLILLVVWVVMVSRLGRIPVSARPRRLDLSAMSGAERRWNLILAAFGIGLIAWLNAAATVDWGILGPSLQAGSPGSVLLVIGLFLFLVAMVAGVAYGWRRATAAYRERRGA